MTMRPSSRVRSPRTLRIGAFRAVFRFHVVAVVAPLAFLVAPASAFAQESAASTAVAQSLFDEGMHATQAGRFADACPKFEESQRLDPALGTEFQLGNCYEKTGRIASAWSLFRDVEGKARLRGQQDRVDVSKGRADALESRLPRLRVEASANEAADLEITRDGVAVGRGQWGVAVPVDAGEHVVIMSRPGRTSAEARVRTAEGEVAVVRVPELGSGPRVVARALPTGASAEKRDSEAPPAAAHPADKDPSSARKTIALVTAGAGIVGLGVGTALGLAAKSRWDASNDASRSSLCTANDECGPEGQSIRSDARRTALIATVVVGAGAAAVVTSAVLFLTAPKSSPSRARALAVAPTVGPDLRPGFAVHGRF